MANLTGRVVVGVTSIVCCPVLLVAGIAMSTSGGGAGSQVTPGLAAKDAIPQRALDAYQQAATDEGCTGLDWTMLAAIGAVESRHGQTGGSTLDAETGETTRRIFGPQLDGHGGTAAIPIGPWIGWWGLTGPWAQAVGPLQFLPATFTAYAVDADQDIDDAAATTARYVCSGADAIVDGVTEVARIYNPGDPGYADRLATERGRILEAVNASTDLAAGATGALACPVTGPIEFTDTYGAPRSGGRLGSNFVGCAGFPGFVR